MQETIDKIILVLIVLMIVGCPVDRHARPQFNDDASLFIG